MVRAKAVVRAVVVRVCTMSLCGMMDAEFEEVVERMSDKERLDSLRLTT